jgi:hypothetical protein
LSRPIFLVSVLLTIHLRNKYGKRGRNENVYVIGFPGWGDVFFCKKIPSFFPDTQNWPSHDSCTPHQWANPTKRCAVPIQNTFSMPSLFPRTSSPAKNVPAIIKTYIYLYFHLFLEGISKAMRACSKKNHVF